MTAMFPASAASLVSESTRHHRGFDAVRCGTPGAPLGPAGWAFSRYRAAVERAGRFTRSGTLRSPWHPESPRHGHSSSAAPVPPGTGHRSVPCPAPAAAGLSQSQLGAPAGFGCRSLSRSSLRGSPRVLLCLLSRAAPAQLPLVFFPLVFSASAPTFN